MKTPIQKTLKPEAAEPGASGAEPPAHPLDALLARLPGLVYRCRYDPARTVEFASAGCQALLGLAPAEIIRDGLGFIHFICPQDHERVRREIAEALARHDTFACEYRVKPAGDERRTTVWEQGRAVRDRLGNILALEGYVGGLASQTQHRREFQIQQARSFQSINLLASGIAHDFNNVIAGIIGSAEVIKMDAPPDQPDSQALEQIFTASKHACQMIRQLKNFSQRQPCQRTLIQLPPVVAELLQLFRSSLPATVELVQHLDQTCPAVLADPAQIQQTVLSLCTNVRRSLAGQKGEINVRLETCDVDADLAAAHPGLRASPHVRLSVRVTGGHFSKGVMERMFEPFACKQTTGHDSGLELFAVREIVHAHEGAITVDSAPGEGTVFQLYFPIPTNDDGLPQIAP